MQNLIFKMFLKLLQNTRQIHEKKLKYLNSSIIKFLRPLTFTSKNSNTNSFSFSERLISSIERGSKGGIPITGAPEK